VLSEAALKMSQVHDLVAVRDLLLDVLLSATPADRAAVLIDNAVWERQAGETEARISERTDVVDRIFMSGESFLSDDGSVLCVPIANRNRLGVLFAETSRAGKRFDFGDLLLLQGTGRVAADTVANVLYTQRLEQEVERLERQIGIHHDLLGDSSAMSELRSSVTRVAPTNSTVLIRGESGTGKELVARAIHHMSSRSRGPFVPVNCGGFPEHLLESELFGHEKGAFTGALMQKRGEFEAAHGGTIFLDEIGELPLVLQPKFLRVLEERQIKRVGGTRQLPVDVRIIAATNRDLKQAIADKQFREDLYYRLNVVPIHTPPLRERVNDVPLLALYFAQKFATEMGRHFKGIDPDAEALLVNHRWPGNVRELRNVIEHAIVNLTGEILAPSHLPLELSEGVVKQGRYHEGIEACKRALIRNAWIQGGRQAKRAAEILDIPPTSMHHLIDKLGMKDELRGL
jgi:two-component system, NtrC family, response regulator HydG